MLAILEYTTGTEDLRRKVVKPLLKLIHSHITQKILKTSRLRIRTSWYVSAKDLHLEPFGYPSQALCTRSNSVSDAHSKRSKSSIERMTEGSLRFLRKACLHAERESNMCIGTLSLEISPRAAVSVTKLYAAEANLARMKRIYTVGGRASQEKA